MLKKSLKKVETILKNLEKFEKNVGTIMTLRVNFKTLYIKTNKVTKNQNGNKKYKPMLRIAPRAHDQKHSSMN